MGGGAYPGDGRLQKCCCKNVLNFFWDPVATFRQAREFSRLLFKKGKKTRGSGHPLKLIGAHPLIGQWANFDILKF